MNSSKTRLLIVAVQIKEILYLGKISSFGENSQKELVQSTPAMLILIQKYCHVKQIAVFYRLFKSSQKVLFLRKRKVVTGNCT